MQYFRPTHEIEIGGRWHEAECYQYRNRRRGLPQWAYSVPSLDRTVSGAEMKRAEKEGRVRPIAKPSEVAA